MEEWKDIPYWDGYIVSNTGEVARKSDGLVLKQHLQKSGYVAVYLNRGYGRKALLVHVLVAMAFHGTDGYRRGMYVDHIDTNRANNHADNLHWVTPLGNARNPVTMAKRRRNDK